MKTLLIFLTFTIFLFSENNVSLETIKNDYLKTDNVWIGIYKNRKDLSDKKVQLEKLEKQIKKISRRSSKYETTKQKISLLKNEINIIEDIEKRLENTIAFQGEEIDKISMGLLSFVFKTHNAKIKRYEQRYKNLEVEFDEAVNYFDEFITKYEIDKVKKKKYKKFLDEIEKDKEYFELSKSFLDKQVEILKLYKNLIAQKRENYKNEDLPNIGVTVLFFSLILFIFFYSKRVIDNTVDDEDKQFAYKNILNIALLVISALFIMFLFLENIIYAATILGVLGAGFIIASKEMILNYPAWLYLQFTGFLKIGDRIKYIDQGEHCIGDIISISPIKITMYETINHTTLTELKRAGRVLFFPTHYIFTRSIYNYTHEDMKTIYDLIEFDLTLESNFKKAEEIALEVTIRNTSKYIELASKQYESLKRKYQMRNFNNRPQVQFVYGKDGSMEMYIWYIAPYREVLNVRSMITQEIIEECKKHSDIIFRIKD